MKKIETIEEYRLLALRTLPDLGSKMSNKLHMDAGVTGELLGEVVDILKKKLAYNKEVDTVHLGEELADTVWYCAGIETMLGGVSHGVPAGFQIENILEVKKKVIGNIQNIGGKEISCISAKCIAFLLANRKHINLDTKQNTEGIVGICMAICELHEIDFFQALTNNIAKLQVRYPEKFTTEAALNRDLEAERKELEK